MRALRIVMLGLFVSLLCAGPAAFGENHLGPPSQEADIVDFDFDPRELEVDVGDTIEWTNKGARPHTVTDRGGTFDTGPIGPNAKDRISMTVPGTYYFFCRINPGKMNGVLVVDEGDEPSQAVRIQATDPDRFVPSNDDKRVVQEALRFDPNEIEVETGTAIVFANVGGKPHSLTADDGSFDTGIVTPGAGAGKFAGSNASIVLNDPGEFAFHCDVHPEAMKGVIEVKGEKKKGGPGAASGAPSKASVEIVDFAFEPDEVSVAAGGTVTWKNTGDAPHTATFDDVDLDTATIESGNEGALVAPAEPASYSYRCNIHPARMRGTLVVVGQNVRDPTAAATEDRPPEATATVAGGGVTTLALATGVGGAFLAGFGLSALVRNRPKPDERLPG